MDFRIRFVASDIRPVVLDEADAEELLAALAIRYDKEKLGMADLVGRLTDSKRGDEITVDETQASELRGALGEIALSRDPLSRGLASLNAACAVYEVR